jgi:peptide/nickel transport system substrate-binding protein
MGVLPRSRAVAIVLAVAVWAASCGDDGGSDAGEPVPSAESTTTAVPRRGGVATIGQFSAPPGLDPARISGGGNVGGNEVAAIYDTVVRYNPTSAKYEPRTAVSVESTPDYSSWTVKLRPNIKFSDGTDYNAEAVKFAFERVRTEGATNVRAQVVQFIQTVTVVDPLTIRFDLKLAWSGFPYLLAGSAGMAYSVAAFQNAGSAQAFNTNPGDAGAGPFKVKSFKPGEVLELERNPTYYGGDVYIDGLRFVLIPGAPATYEAIKAGTLQAGQIRDPGVIARAKTDGQGTVDTPQIAGDLIQMNAGVQVTCTDQKPENLCRGVANGQKVTVKTPTADVNVRRAVVAAVDPKVINERAYQGTAFPNSAPFANAPWDPKIAGPKYDLDEAKRLVQRAKTAGWDGKIRYLDDNTPLGVARAQAISAMLQQAGMDVVVDTTKDRANVAAQVNVNRDYDLVGGWAWGLLDDPDSNYPQLAGTFDPNAPRYGYTSPDIVAALELLRVANTTEKQVAAYKAISEVWIRDAPSHVITMIPQAMIHTPKLHGLERSAISLTLFDKAWLDN